jgi:type IV pilus assembly protein PilN
MIRINLLAGERGKAKKKAVLDLGQQILLGCGLIVVLAAGVVGWRYWSLSSESARLDMQIAEATREKTRLDGIIRLIQQYETQTGQITDRVNLIEQLKSNQTGPVHLLDEVSRAIPNRLWLTSMRQGPASPNAPGMVEVAMEGSATVQTQLPDFIANLQRSGYFDRQIDIISALTGEVPAGFTSTGNDLTTFSIRAQFRQPVAAPAAGAAPGAPQAPPPAGRAGG